MITIIIAFLLGFLISFFLFKNTVFGDEGPMYLLSFVAGVACAGLGAGIAFNLPHTLQNKIIKVENIESLQDNTNVKGSFFIGSGIIGTESVYSLYVNDGLNIMRKDLPASLTVIRYKKFAKL